MHTRIEELLGGKKYGLFTELLTRIQNAYAIEPVYGPGGKKWDVECKFRKGGKTLCGLYVKKDVLGFMIIFGAAERDKVQDMRDVLSNKSLDFYDNATVYHDGKWVMFEVEDGSMFEDFDKLLLVKRKPVTVK